MLHLLSVVDLPISCMRALHLGVLDRDTLWRTCGAICKGHGELCHVYPAPEFAIRCRCVFRLWFVAFANLLGSFTAGTSIAGGMLAYLFMDSNGSGAAHKVS